MAGGAGAPESESSQRGVSDLFQGRSRTKGCRREVSPECSLAEWDRGWNFVGERDGGPASPRALPERASAAPPCFPEVSREGRQTPAHLGIAPQDFDGARV